LDQADGGEQGADDEQGTSWNTGEVAFTTVRWLTEIWSAFVLIFF
jgi:hypothetical protein